MLYTVPDYYFQFQCIADDCEDTCCAGWQIVADPVSLKRYRAEKGSYREKLKKKIDWKNSCYKQDHEHRCAFLQEDNLCEMYINLGEKSLCKTCKRYPRHIEEFENSREITLSVSCPEVARILMNKMEPVTFRVAENDKEEEYDDFNLLLFDRLLDARDVLYRILQNRKESVNVRMGLAYGLGRDMQRRLNQGELFGTDEVLEKYEKEQAAAFVKRKLSENHGKETFSFMKKMFHRLFQLELLRKDWGLFLLETEKRLFSDMTPETYTQMTEEFLAWMERHQMNWEIRKEQLLVYFISTYFGGAVYDGEILRKVQFALLGVDFIEELLKSRWLRNEKDLNEEELIEIVYRYSREVEHSDFNLKKMEKMMPFEHGKFC